MTHCHSGVQKGIAKSGTPIEVMGLLLGRPCPNSPSLIVTDVFPLPIEGFETRVIADDDTVINHMIALGESLENTRKEKFMGWYHSHPFDVSQYSHCFLSQTDVSTQLQWQRAEDPHGNPFLAIVVDPLRSTVKNTPILKAFRCYPPEYTQDDPHTCPNGQVITEEQARLEQWGSCWSSYYELEVEYFMSKGARNVMNLLTQNFLWMRTLTSDVTTSTSGGGGQQYNGEGHNGCGCAERIGRVAEKIRRLDVGSSSGEHRGGGVDIMLPEYEQGERVGSSGVRGTLSRGTGGVGRATSNPRSTGGAGGMSGTALSATTAGVSSGRGDDKPGLDKEEGGELGKACQTVVDIATEKLVGSIVQVTKKELFSS
eukprot:scaffold60906_cov61-Cyclotella_meneghiniana.AAC.3